MDKNDLIAYINEKFSDLNTSIANAISVLIQTPSQFAPSTDSVISLIFNTVLGTAYVLAALFFIIDLCNKTLMFETSNYEVTVKLLLRFILAKVIVENCRGIMGIIFNAFSGISTQLGGGSLSNPLGSNVAQGLIDHVNTMDGGVFGINYLAYKLELMPTMLMLWVASIIAGVIVLGRMFEIMIYTAIAPLPLSTLAGEMSHDTAKKFLQNYIAVCLQGIIIIIAFRLFGGIIVDSYSGNIGVLTYLMLVVVLCLTLFKSGTWAKQIVGIA